MDTFAATPSTRPDEADSAPLVSVVIPAYNGERTLGTTLESLERQTYPKLECVIVNDGSRDQTQSVAEAYANRHPATVRVVRHDENHGLSKTLNHGISETNGPLILILHQDIVMLSPEWIGRGVQDLLRFSSADVVTGDYGIPDPKEVGFVQRSFGVLRRQFHAGPAEGVESVTFSEFKCDLIRAEVLKALGGFPERFRIAGEDLWVSYSLRAQGRGILKDYGMKSVQRFTGDATSVSGNLRKEFIFGRAFSGTLMRFGTLPARGLKGTPYSRSRAWNRASQPLVLLLGLALLLAWLVLRDPGWLDALVALVVVRLVYYALRLYPDVARLLGRRARAVAESLGGSVLGFLSDFAYSFGLVAGMLRWSLGGRV